MTDGGPPLAPRRSWLPLLETLRGYGREDFTADAIAGTIVGIVTLPQAIAYAVLAGLPPEAGLYACLAPLILYALLGSSRHLMVGPVAVAALMVAAAISTYGPRFDTENHGAALDIAAVICIEAGAMLVLLRMLQLGGLVNLLSHPVIVGFVNAAAVLIFFGQIPLLLGAPGGGTGFAVITSLPDQIAELNPATASLGIGTLILLLGLQFRGGAWCRKLGFDLPDGHPVLRLGPLVATLAGGACVAVFNLDDQARVAVVGAVPAGLPAIGLPPLQSALWVDLLPVSALVAVVAYVESYSIGTTLATRIGSRLNANQELVALGAANLAAGITGAYPVAGSFSRSSIAFQTGARTQVSGLISAALILLALLLLMPLVAWIPHTVLAAIIMVSVLGIIDIHSARKHWRGHRDESATEIATFLAVIVAGVELGLLTGVALALALFVRQSSRPRLIVVGQVGDTGQVRSVRRYEVVTHARVLAVRIDENIFFANANPIEQRLLTLIGQHPDTRHLVLVCSAVNRIDVTGIEMLARVSRNLAAARIILHLTDVKAQVLRQIEAADLPRTLTGQIFFSADQALRALDPGVTADPAPR